MRILSALPEIKWDECMKDEHPDEVAKHRSLDLLVILFETKQRKTLLNARTAHLDMTIYCHIII